MYESIREDVIKNKKFSIILDVLGYDIYPHQLEMLDKMNDTSHIGNVIIGPRACGKSTVTLIDCIYKLLKYPYSKILYVSNDIEVSLMMINQIERDCNTQGFKTIFSNINIDNIIPASIYDNKPYSCDYIVFHDISLNSKYHNQVDLINSMDKIIDNRNNLFYNVIGSQQIYGDIYTILKNRFIYSSPLYV